MNPLWSQINLGFTCNHINGDSSKNKEKWLLLPLSDECTRLQACLLFYQILGVVVLIISVYYLSTYSPIFIALYFVLHVIQGRSTGISPFSLH